MKYKRRKRLKFIAYNIVVVFLIFLAIEGYLTWNLNNPESCPQWLYKPLRSYYGEYDCAIFQYQPHCAHYDSTRFYELNPGNFNFSNREFSNEFRVNSQGFRDDEKSLDYPKIVVLGDSYTMGWGVDQDQTYPQLLENVMGYGVLNTGISSYGTAREISSLDKVNTDSMEYLIIQYCPNDLVENKQFILNDNKLIVSTENVYNNLVKQHQKRKDYFLFKHLYYTTVFLSSDTLKKDAAVPTNSKPNKPRKKIHGEKAFLEIIRNCDRIPAHTRIIVFALEAERCHNGFNDQLRKLLEMEFTSSLADRISFVDLGGLIESTHRHKWDPHLNASGHQVVANKLAQRLEELMTDTITIEKHWLYPSGDTSVICTYTGGLKNGCMKTYWPGNRISGRFQFKNGAAVGRRYLYDTTGIITDSSYATNL